MEGSEGELPGQGRKEGLWVRKQPNRNVEVAWVEDTWNNRGLQVEEAQNVGSGD